MTERYIKSEYDAYERLGYTNPLMNERRRRYWDDVYKSSLTSRIVTTKEELAGDLSSELLYIIDGQIDMGDTSILVPKGGLRLHGHGFGISGLYSTEDNYTMFIDDGVYSGDLFTHDMDLSVTGTSSQLYDLDNDGNSNTFEFNNVNFVNCTSIGSIDSYRQFFASGCGFINPSDGFNFIGPCTGQAIIDSIVLGLGSGVTLFKAGTGFVIGSSLRSNLNAINIDDNATVFDYSPSNFTTDGSFYLDGFRTNLNADAVPNTPASSVKAQFVNCSGIDNTYPGISWTISTGATTTITTANTLVKLAGTTTASNDAWFEQTGDNEITYLSSLPRAIKVEGIITLSGGANDQAALQIRKFIFATSTYENIGPRYVATLNGGLLGTRGELLTIVALTEINEGDRIEVWVENQTDTTDISSVAGGILSISSRV